MDEPQVAMLTELIEQLRPAGMLYTPKLDGTLKGLRRWLALSAAEFRERIRVLVEEEFDPTRTSELLPDWERWLGLPDPLLPADPPPTTYERRAAILGKLRALGGQSPYYFINVAAELGYAIEIEEFDRTQIGDVTGTPILEWDMEYTWLVHAPTFTIHHARAGASVAGDPIGTVGNALLEAFFGRIKPSHTVLYFAYDLPP